jgi:hypothetical protein
MLSALLPAKGSIISRIAKHIREVYANRRVKSENMLDLTTTTLDFKIAANVIN